MASKMFPGSNHDHDRCVRRALARAEQVCGERKARLTPIRRRVLELVWSSHRPVLAYDLLDSLRDEQRRAAPPTVYRALDFLLDLGLIHRLESLNAFVGCEDPERSHDGQFLICDACRRVAEIDAPEIGRAVDRNATGAGFEVRRRVIEVRGLCRSCRGH